jgi:hypothetical protein
MRWYIGRGDLDTHPVTHLVGVIIAPDCVSKEDVEDIMARGGWEIFVRPWWARNESYSILTWEEVRANWKLHQCAITGAEHGQIWYRGQYRQFLVIYWDEVVRRVASEPAAFVELDRLAQKKGSFRNAKRIAELLRLLDQE